MDIVIIGTGNTATLLGRTLKAAGHRIVQVYGRSSMAASELAYELGTESTTYWNVVNKDAQIFLLAVSDIAIEEIVRELHLSDKTIVHTAGSVSKNVLQNASLHYGIFYPLQSLRKEANYLPEVPIIIDASDPATLQQLENLASTISNTVITANDHQRLQLHLAAVFCNNFVNHLYVLMEEYCRKEGLDFTILLPLIRETTDRLKTMSPASSQTGPAIRKDMATIEKHIELLSGYPQLRNLYMVFTESIMSGIGDQSK